MGAARRMDIRPFTNKLRAVFGPNAFVRQFDTRAGGGRHVRFAALVGVVDGEVDVRRTSAVAGDRWVQVDLHEDGRHSASHFLVTADCPVDSQGPQRMRASTLPSPFEDRESMIVALYQEATRTDHPAVRS